jgi:hypothetical protein
MEAVDVPGARGGFAGVSSSGLVGEGKKIVLAPLGEAAQAGDAACARERRCCCVGLGFLVRRPGTGLPE